MSTLQLFDALDPATEAALRASIDRFGVIVPVVRSAGPWEPDALIDGHHRSRIADELGVGYRVDFVTVADEGEAAEVARTLNADRRHLSPEQRREIVARLRQQGHSQRAIAGALGVGQSTVRDDLEQVSGTTHLPNEVRGADGKTYPAQRPAPEPEQQDEAEPLFAEGEPEAILDTLEEAHGDELTADHITDALNENIESKQLPDPAPKPWEPSKPDLGDGVSHPARYSTQLIPLIEVLLEHYSPGRRVLDPFAGTGRIHELRPNWDTHGIELEPEWAALSDWTQQGNALHLPYTPESFDAIATSPTYGNRLADSHNATDPERRRSYTHDLGRPLHNDNSGDLHWRTPPPGTAAATSKPYRDFHLEAWTEATRMLRPGGVFILNCCDHVRDGIVQPVTAWHCWALGYLGLNYIESRSVPTRKLRQGANGELREQEQVHVFRRPR